MRLWLIVFILCAVVWYGDCSGKGKKLKVLVKTGGKYAWKFIKETGIHIAFLRMDHFTREFPGRHSVIKVKGGVRHQGLLPGVVQQLKLRPRVDAKSHF